MASRRPRAVARRRILITTLVAIAVAPTLYFLTWHMSLVGHPRDALRSQKAIVLGARSDRSERTMIPKAARVAHPGPAEAADDRAAAPPHAAVPGVFADCRVYLVDVLLVPRQNYVLLVGLGRRAFVPWKAAAATAGNDTAAFEKQFERAMRRHEVIAEVAPGENPLRGACGATPRDATARLVDDVCGVFPTLSVSPALEATCYPIDAGNEFGKVMGAYHFDGAAPGALAAFLAAHKARRGGGGVRVRLLPARDDGTPGATVAVDARSLAAGWFAQSSRPPPPLARQRPPPPQATAQAPPQAPPPGVTMSVCISRVHSTNAFLWESMAHLRESGVAHVYLALQHHGCILILLEMSSVR